MKTFELTFHIREQVLMINHHRATLLIEAPSFAEAYDLASRLQKTKLDSAPINLTTTDHICVGDPDWEENELHRIQETSFSRRSVSWDQVQSLIEQLEANEGN